MNDPFVMGGVIIDDVLPASQWMRKADDAPTWEESDIMVDKKWLKLALEHGLLDGNGGDYLYANQSHVSSMELERSAEVVLAVNAARRIKYRITIGTTKRLGVLMKRTN